jgi:hypothetical protein
MPRGFDNYVQPFMAVNSYGQNQNCYYCTVAALNGRTTHDLVGITETMMQDTAKPYEITALFNDAGNNDIQSDEAFNAFQVSAGMNNPGFTIGTAVGLAYTRQDGSGHMVVMRKMFNTLQCLDYQQAYTGNDMPPRYLPFPPEPNIVRYIVFYRA